ncbi:hypothetical protein [Aggregatilinea lenta]|uniref:hypothetical protein n=1 Tax=Aggregatilinea lenta TaxID=913108 RepID=UPI000E5B472A|nr:hypothetical protein [Aggregatilinea lenta]
MSKEGPQLQFDMFTGEPVDNRTRKQKRQDKERGQPKQTEMFSQREIAQFGVNPHPLLPLSSNTKLLLIPEDPRTEEDIERDTQREAEKQTLRMFGEPLTITEARLPETAVSEIAPDTTTLALVSRGIVAVVIFGYFS